MSKVNINIIASLLFVVMAVCFFEDAIHPHLVRQHHPEEPQLSLTVTKSSPQPLSAPEPVKSRDVDSHFGHSQFLLTTLVLCFLYLVVKQKTDFIYSFILKMNLPSVPTPPPLALF